MDTEEIEGILDKLEFVQRCVLGVVDRSIAEATLISTVSDICDKDLISQ